jgi:SAM-dependent methyltransferase
MTTKVEKSLVHDDSADLVTFFHGLHLVDTSAALQEAWRMLKPGAKLIAAWNDRDLSSPFMKELEDIMELHISNYNRHQKQRAVDIWSERLTEGALFRLIEYAVHPNPIKMHSPTSLLDILDCLSFVRANLQGPNRKSFNKDVRTLLERRFDHHSFDLPLETKIYVLEKVSEEERRSGNKKYQHHLGGGKKRKLK